MFIIGLLSTKQEVEEIKFIANVCKCEDRIHYLIRMEKLKDMLKKERENK